MENSLKRILTEYYKLKGQFVITDTWKVERLITIGDDNMDYYWVTYNGRDLTWYSCVGSIIPLKGYIRKKDYNKFIRIAKLNHFDQLNKDAFLVSLKEYVEKYPSDHKFLTEFCWDLN